MLWVHVDTTEHHFNLYVSTNIMTLMSVQALREAKFCTKTIMVMLMHTIHKHIYSMCTAQTVQ